MYESEITHLLVTNGLIREREQLKPLREVSPEVLDRGCCALLDLARCVSSIPHAHGRLADLARAADKADCGFGLAGVEERASDVVVRRGDAAERQWRREGDGRDRVLARRRVQEREAPLERGERGRVRLAVVDRETRVGEEHERVDRIGVERRLADEHRWRRGLRSVEPQLCVCGSQTT